MFYSSIVPAFRAMSVRRGSSCSPCRTATSLQQPTTGAGRCKTIVADHVSIAGGLNRLDRRLTRALATAAVELAPNPGLVAKACQDLHERALWLHIGSLRCSLKALRVEWVQYWRGCLSGDAPSADDGSQVRSPACSAAA